MWLCFFFMYFFSCASLWFQNSGYERSFIVDSIYLSLSFNWQTKITTSSLWICWNACASWKSHQVIPKWDYWSHPIHLEFSLWINLFVITFTCFRILVMLCIFFFLRDIIRGNPDVKWESIKGLETAKRLLKEAVVMPIKYPKYVA